MYVGTAFRAFFVALRGGERAELIRRVLDGQLAADTAKTPALPAPQPAAPQPTSKAAPLTPPPARSEAISLLAALQREARLVDLVKEPLESFADAQVGAAARPCLKQCAQVLDRMFELTAVTDVPEGGDLALPARWSPARYQVVGEGAVAEGRPLRVVHPGWRAAACRIPQWSGDREDAMIVAPAQVEPAT